MQENVNVGVYHGEFMTSSRSQERFRSIPRRTPPMALNTGNSIRLRRLAFALERMSIKPSSTSDVRGRPSSAARCVENPTVSQPEGTKVRISLQPARYLAVKKTWDRSDISENCRILYHFVEFLVFRYRRKSKIEHRRTYSKHGINLGF